MRNVGKGFYWLRGVGIGDCKRKEICKGKEHRELIDIERSCCRRETSFII